MSYKHACVVDRQNQFVEFVVCYFNGKDWEISGYEMQEGERLVDAPYPFELVKPYWTGSKWEEYATPEEVEEWDEQRQEEESVWGESFDPGQIQEQRLTALEQQTTDTQLALAETYEQSERQSADLMLATAELYESMLALQERVAALEGGVHNG